MVRVPERRYDPKSIQERVEALWKSKEIPKRAGEIRKGEKRIYFLDGPPYVTGSIHVGTAWNKVLKDLYIRYKTMRGFWVTRRPGFDMHGLPIEVKVEGELGIKSKKEIEEKIGVDNFIRYCKEYSLRYMRVNTEQFRKLGVWMDWENPYLPITNEYIESAWWTLKRAHERGLLERGLGVIFWCPRCETALAEHEVRGEYRDVEDPSIFIRFRVKNESDEEEKYLLVWTTTPWTVPSNLAIAVHPEYDYAEVEVDENGKSVTYIVAYPLVDKVMGKIGRWSYKVRRLLKGYELEGIEYEFPLSSEIPFQKGFKHKVILGEFVTLEEGTGLVHIAPGFGEEDFQVGEKYSLPVFCPVGPDGKFTPDGGKYEGMYVKEADPVVIEDLRRKGALLKEETIVHSYPHCWRCKTPLIFRATEQWFLRVHKIKEKILEENSKKVKWVPEWVAKRYENGVREVGDWCISRQRYWGIPMPIWVCENCNSFEVIGSREELERLSLGEIPEDLHRPWIDSVEIKCRKCNGRMKRVKDVLDVWFDSGIASWASLGYPSRKEEFEELWPADFIVEGQDQVTKWFYSQQAVSVIAFDTVPYREVLMHGFVLDPTGEKLSKSKMKGKKFTPEGIIEEFGIDAFRFYFLWATAPWEDPRVDEEELGVVYRTLNVLWNSYYFSASYMNLDNYSPEKKGKLKLEDKWILSRINSLKKEVTEHMDRHEYHKASRKIQEFILEDLSRWYIKLVRSRTWIEGEDEEKYGAYYSLYNVLVDLSKLMAPFTPYISEEIYTSLTGRESVHLEEWPEVNEELIDKKLEEEMEICRKVVETTVSLRQKARIKLRWPLRRIVILPRGEDVIEAIMNTSEIIKEQSNLKEVLIASSKTENNSGSKEITLELIDGGRVFLSKYLSEEIDKIGTVYLDCEIDEELKSEAWAREIIRRIQEMRKQLDLDMEEKIRCQVSAKEEVLEMISSRIEEISRETRSSEIALIEESTEISGDLIKKWRINNVEVTIGISSSSEKR